MCSLGPTQTISGVSLSNDATNLINGSLESAPRGGFPFEIQGAAWADAAQSSEPPGTVTAQASEYLAFVQPYVSGRYALPTAGFLGPDFPLAFPAAVTTGVVDLYLPASYVCSLSTRPFALTNFRGVQPILGDVRSGMDFEDPYPSSWLRLFQYCHVSSVTLPRPNSTATDEFVAIEKETTSFPSSPVVPMLTAAQSPMLNNASLFQSATLNTTSVTISWAPPATGSPFGYLVSVYELATNNAGTLTYTLAGGYFTAKTSVDIPPIVPGNTYAFAIVASSDGNANVEKSPRRSKVPTAEAGLISAPFVIAAGATAAIKNQ